MREDARQKSMEIAGEAGKCVREIQNVGEWIRSPNLNNTRQNARPLELWTLLAQLANDITKLAM